MKKNQLVYIASGVAGALIIAYFTKRSIKLHRKFESAITQNKYVDEHQTMFDYAGSVRYI